MNTINLYTLNATAIKKSLKNLFKINVKSCKKSGNSTQIVVHKDDKQKALNAFREIGIVSTGGKQPFIVATFGNFVQFSNCYMSEEVYNSLN